MRLLSLTIFVFLVGCTTTAEITTVPADAPKVYYFPSEGMKSGESLPQRTMTLEEYLEYLKPESYCDSERGDPTSNCNV